MPAAKKVDRGLPRRVLFLVGASGSGKSVIGARVAKLTGRAFLDTDQKILDDSGYERISDMFDERGESAFRSMEAQCIHAIDGRADKLVVATGGGLPVVDGLMERMNDVGVTIYLKASLETLWKRLNADPRQLDNRPLLRHDGKTVLSRMLQERDAVYSRATLTVDTDQLSVDEVCSLLAVRTTPFWRPSLGRRE